MSVDQFEEVNQKWKYSNEQTSELSWQKVEAVAMGSSQQKIWPRAEKGTLIIVHVLFGWLTSSYAIYMLFPNISAKEFQWNPS